MDTLHRSDFLLYFVDWKFNGFAPASLLADVHPWLFTAFPSGLLLPWLPEEFDQVQQQVDEDWRCDHDFFRGAFIDRLHGSIVRMDRPTNAKYPF